MSMHVTKAADAVRAAAVASGQGEARVEMRGGKRVMVFEKGEVIEGKIIRPDLSIILQRGKFQYNVLTRGVDLTQEIVKSAREID